MDVLVNVGGVFSGHHLVDGGPALLLAILLCGSHPARPGLEGKQDNDFYFSVTIKTYNNEASTSVSAQDLRGTQGLQGSEYSQDNGAFQGSPLGAISRFQ